MGIHSRRCLGNTTGMRIASRTRLRNQLDVVLVGGNIWKGDKCSVGVELDEITPYD